MTAPASDELAARAIELRRLIAYHNERYHMLDSPEIADADFDLLVRDSVEFVMALLAAMVPRIADRDPTMSNAE